MTFCPMIVADRIAELRPPSAVLLHYIDAVGRYEGSSERVGNQAPAMRQRVDAP